MKIRPSVLAFAIILGFAITGCSKKDNEDSSAPPEPTAVVDPATAGAITGTVTFEGTPPKFHAIDMSAEAACVQENPKPVVPPIVVLGPHDALADTVVYIKSGLGAYRYDTPTDPAVLDQKGCMYVPRVLAVRTDQPLEIKNTDPVTHNVHPMPRENKSWNRSLPEGSEPFMTKFPHQELAIPVACNIHPWMRAFLFVFDNPFYDVTTKTGTFELKGLPPGTYTIEAWHEHFGTLDQAVTLGPKESKAISFKFSEPH
ncbi:MAG: carboxypeptidase regulatory-like domain-containing protein [Candidatus Acidiferrales bacterium]